MRGDDPGGAASAGGGLIVWACRQLIVWGAALLVFYLVIAHLGLLMPHDAAKPQTPASPSSADRQGTTVVNSLVFRADKQGHVVVDAAVNGAPVRFLVDTGATVVTLTAGDAANAGIGRGDLSFNLVFNTANGRARAAPVTLREIRIGQVSLDDVPAVVAENLNVSLLGMNFLSRLESYEMRDGILTMNW